MIVLSLKIDMTHFTNDSNNANRHSPASICWMLRRSGFPEVRFVSRSPRSLDRRGSDYQAIDREGKILHVDLKDLKRAPDEDRRVVIETHMQGRRWRAGWATDTSKLTDVLLYRWGNGALLSLPYKPLRRAVRRNLKSWRRKYAGRSNLTKGHHEVFRSHFLLVPQRDLKAELRRNG